MKGKPHRWAGGGWTDTGTDASKVVGGKMEKTLPSWVVGIGVFFPAGNSRNLRVETEPEKEAGAPSSRSHQPHSQPGLCHPHLELTPSALGPSPSRLIAHSNSPPTPILHTVKPFSSPPSQVGRDRPQAHLPPSHSRAGRAAFSSKTIQKRSSQEPLLEPKRTFWNDGNRPVLSSTVGTHPVGLFETH